MGSFTAAAPALAAAMLFGASTPFAKRLLGDVDPWLLAGLLYLGSGVGLAVLSLARRGLTHGPAAEAPLSRADLPWLGAVVLLGGALGPLLLMLGLRQTPAATASLLLNAEAIATMLIAWLVFHENADRRIVLGAGAIVAGAALLSWHSGTLGGSWGTLLILGACLAWGIDNNLSRRLSAADPVLIAMIKGLVAGTANLGLALIHGASWPSLRPVIEAGALGFLGYGASLVMFMRALRGLGAARTGAYFSLAPFIGAIIAVSLFGEPITTHLILAAALMGLGLYLHLAERHEHEHAHETMQHDHAHGHDAHHDHEHAPDVPAGEPHSHPHTHRPMIHRHPHYPDLHHRHRHHDHA
jgi:drug/metabolite transporter (DMT)-like permease